MANANSKQRAKWRPLLHDAQGGICAYCGEPLPEKVPAKLARPGLFNSGRIATLDHVFPLKRERWRGTAGNLLLVHARPCNSRKGNRMPTACEVIMLMAVNARLGVKLREPPAGYVRPRWQTIDELRAEESARDKARHQSTLAAQGSLPRAWHRLANG